MARSADELRAFRRKLRAHPSSAEVLFGERLYRAGIEHHFQLILGFYIVDFVIDNRLVIIEIDGPVHGGDEAKRYDRCRDNFLASVGFTVYRVPNEDVGRVDLSFLQQLPEVPGSRFRSCLAKANSVKSKQIRRARGKATRMGPKRWSSKTLNACFTFYNNLRSLRCRPWAHRHPLFEGLGDLLKRRCMKELRRRWKAAKAIERKRVKDNGVRLGTSPPSKIPRSV